MTRFDEEDDRLRGLALGEEQAALARFAVPVSEEFERGTGCPRIPGLTPAYAEQGAVLRPDISLNAAEQFCVFRHVAGQEEGPMQWRQLRAGMIEASRLMIRQPSAGVGYELEATAAVVIGGGSLTGSGGSVLSTLIGAFVMACCRTAAIWWASAPIGRR